MNRRRLSLLHCLLVCLCAVPLVVVSATSPNEQTRIRVDESATRIALADKLCKVSLVIENATGSVAAARINFELIDPNDKIVSQTHVDAELKRGTNRVEGSLALNAFLRNGEERKELPWYRVRYRVAPQARAVAAFDAFESIVSISEIARDLFELRVAASKRVHEGQLLRARVRATHPLNGRAVRDVKLVGEVSFDDEKEGTRKIEAHGETDSEGYATLDFQLPRSITDDDIDLSVKGRLGDAEQEVSDSIDLDRRARVLVSTDKPLYQPGQIVHLRALVVTNEDRALASAGATLKIEDPEGTTVFDSPLKTSRFGVASCDWKLADNTRLGDYQITVSLEDGKWNSDDYDNEGSARIKISRYDLPDFTVAAKPDRDYYLGGESASVEVRADYLFGQPVKRAHVRIVRESERHWNFAEQKYDVEEGEKYEGEADEAGRFLAHIDLSKAHAKLAESSYERFEDLTFAAYATDPTTNRTEQRRFRLRLTREPIHIYVTQAAGPPSPNLPLEFFVATSYADGTPAQCEVKIEEKPAEEAETSDSNDATSNSTAARSISSDASTRAHKSFAKIVRTNRFGVAKVTTSAPTWHRGDDESSREVALHFTARDREGRAGQHDDELWLSNNPALRVKTDKSIYRAGQPVEVEIVSDQSDLKVVVEVVANERSLEAQTIKLSGRRAVVSFPYRAEFQNRVTVAAYSAAIPGSSYDSDFVKGTRAVLYPHNRELNLDVKFDSATYKPGEEAAARFQVKTAEGHAAETALGVVVFDKAVEESARTEQEFGSSYGFYDHFRSFWYGDDSLGGITLRDLERLDPAKAITPDLDLAAELLLQCESDYEPNVFGGSDYATDQSSVFAKLSAAELKSARIAISNHYERTNEYPRDEATLRRVLSDAGVDPQGLRDPWDTPYRATFSVEREFDLIEFKSAGADKRFGTADDWKAGGMKFAYFRTPGELLNKVAFDYHRRTGDYLRDVATLKRELARAGLNFDALRDPWGKPYDLRFSINDTGYVFTVWSAGVDGRFSASGGPYSNDDFTLWSVWTDYFAETRKEMDIALQAYLRESSHFPKDEATLVEVMRRAGLRFDSLRDAWGHPYYATFRTDSRYGDRTQTEQRTDAGTHTQVTPVTRTLDVVSIRSAGADGTKGTSDDFNAAEFSAIASEQSAQDAQPKLTPKVTTFASGTGAISGTVADPNGASVANATVTATHEYLKDQTFTATTDEEGVYLLRNLPSGLYTLRVDAPGFKSTVISGIAVHSESLAHLDLSLQVGGLTETVTVMADKEMVMNTEQAMVSRTFESRKVLSLEKKVVAAQKGPVATPRLRKEFPETLVWHPELLTDRKGRGEVKFKLADNITTWKMSVIGSTEKGEIGTVEKEFRAFQPFFVELDPPPVLTEGDEINLPVVVRNYLNSAQRVALDIKPAAWFTLLVPATRETQVAANDSTRETFALRATSAIKDGKQQITARGADAADAIEKTVSVHPDGEEVSSTGTQLVEREGALTVNIPASVVPHSIHAELKVYPNLLAHVIEGVEGVMKRPYGCGEQTISSTYPSLFVLRHYKRIGASDAGLPPAAAKARDYLRQGYERLLSYHGADGGFTYWGRGESDVALTAYALRFLEDARELLEIDDSVLNSARAWLLKQQRPDGSWAAHHYPDTTDARGDAILTAYVARVLARGERKTGDRPANNAQAVNSSQLANNAQPTSSAQTTNGANISTNTQPRSQAATKPAERTPFERALDYLARRSAEFDEPYLLSVYALALEDSGGSPEKIDAATKTLRTLARDEGDGSYFALETNTPFYGWGLAGRIETTALAVSALAKKDSSPDADALVNRGLLFLLKNKDQYGVWYSTQATVSVLDALMNLSPSPVLTPGAQTANTLTSNAQTTDAQTAEVFVNGQSAGTISLPASASLVAPITLDISRFVAAGPNRVEVQRAGSGAQTRATAQVVASYYVPWSQVEADGTLHSERSSRALRLGVEFDKTTARVGEEVSCHVEAERIGHRGYGMLLAEVGLPPGADVDRASLEHAMKSTGWDFSHYDLWPDRIVVYLWASAGGTKFDFTFRPRFGLKAKSAASLIYDYYNPEARAQVQPASFTITEQTRAAQARQ
ncbi:MAG: hypothetical protein QOE33_2176 [Acidobacteriota bacterium]|nr:hypothetical protein [Acidobacteriota bacterium]